MPANRREPPLKTQQLRKRYRQLRRRQLAGALLLGGLAIAVLLALAVGALVLRSCVLQTEGALRARLEQERGENSLPSVVYQQTLSPAPWLAAVADDALYLAGDSEDREAGYPNFPVTNLTAQSFGDEPATLWETDAGPEFINMAATEQSIVLYSHSPTYPEQVALRGFDRVNGHEVWSQTIGNAESPSFASSGKVLAVSYWLSDGYRIVGYNAASGVKAWGYRVGMIEELAGFDMSAGAPRLLLLASPETVCYCLGSSIGFIDSGSGRLLRRAELPVDVSQLSIDWDGGSCLLQSEPDDDGVSTIYRMPVSAGIPVALHRCKPEQGVPQLLGFNGNVVIAYFGRAVDTYDGQLDPEQAACNILNYRPGATEPDAISRFAAGIPVACAAFPGSSHGALVATSRSVGEDGASTGGTTLYRVSPGTGLAHETARLGRPVAGLLPLGRDVVILLRGGELRVYAEPLDRHLSLARLEFQHTDWSFSPTRETLLVTSYPQSHAAGEPSAPLQAIVLQ